MQKNSQNKVKAKKCRKIQNNGKKCRKIYNISKLKDRHFWEFYLGIQEFSKIKENFRNLSILRRILGILQD